MLRLLLLLIRISIQRNTRSIPTRLLPRVFILYSTRENLERTSKSNAVFVGIAIDPEFKLCNVHGSEYPVHATKLVNLPQTILEQTQTQIKKLEEQKQTETDFDTDSLFEQPVICIMCGCKNAKT
jgi:hypothetical protein